MASAVGLMHLRLPGACWTLWISHVIRRSYYLCSILPFCRLCSPPENAMGLTHGCGSATGRLCLRPPGGLRLWPLHQLIFRLGELAVVLGSPPLPLPQPADVLGLRQLLPGRPLVALFAELRPAVGPRRGSFAAKPPSVPAEPRMLPRHLQQQQHSEKPPTFLPSLVRLT